MVMNIINAQAPSLYFSAIGPGNTGPDLYRIAADGTLTPIPLDPGSTAGSNAGENGGYASFNGKLYFFADTADGPAQLLAVNPDGSVTPVPGISGRQNISDDQLPGVNAHFTVFDGKLFFVAQGAQGVDIYSIDANGNVGALDKSGFIDQPVVAGDNVSVYSNDNGFAVFDGGLYFSAINGSFGIPQLFRLDAGSNSPVVVGEDSVAYVGEDGGFVVNAGMLIFNGWPFDTQTDALVGLAAGSSTPQTLTDIFGNPILHTFLTPSRFHGEFFIAADSYTHLGDALFVDQGGNISELHDPFTPDGFGGIAPYLGPGLENGLIDFNGSLYFSANHHLNRLSFSTGVAIIAGVDDTAGEHGGFVVFNNKLYFFAEHLGSTQLYSVDTADQLAAIAGVTGVSGSFSGDAHFTVLGSDLYLAGPTTNGIELIRIDSAGVVHVSDINPGAGSSSLPGAVGGFAVYKPATIGTAGDDQVNGSSDADDIDGAGGNDIINAGGGDDIIRYTVGQGRDVTDGGTGADTLRISDAGTGEAYGIWSVAAWNAAHPASPYTGPAEILVTVGDTIVNELSHVEEIAINVGAATSDPGGAGGSAGNGGTGNSAGGNAPNSLDIEGNFTGTALTTSTITYQGGSGTDTVDLSHRTSPHSVVADGGAGVDTAILGFAFRGAGATYQPVRDAGNNVIGVKIAHTVGSQSVTDTFINFENFVFTTATRTLATLFEDPPVASDDKATANEDTSLVLAGTTLTANDTDPDNDPLTVTAVQNASHGTVSLDSGNVSFTPDANFSGIAGFDYTVGDGKGGFDTAHVAIDVAPKADPVNLHLPAPAATSDFSTGSGGDPVIASLANGTFVVASIVNSRSVSARLFDVHGNPLGNAFQVAASTGKPLTNTHVVALSGGDFVVSWDSFLTVVNGSVTSAAVYAQRFHADGTPDGAQFSPSNGSYGVHNSTTATADGGFVVAWQSDAGVVAQRFDANGASVGASFVVASPGGGAILPVVIGLEGGGFVVSWGPLDSSARIYDAQGHAGDIVSLIGGGITAGTTALAALAGGGFVAEWATTGGEVLARIFNASGIAAQPAFHVANGSFGGVAALPNGGFVVTFAGDSAGREIHAQQFDAAGNAVGTAVRLDQPDAALSDFIDVANAVATLANGDVAAVWAGAANIFPTGFEIGIAGVKNQLVTLSTIVANLNDADGSETSKLVLSGFPTGATFSVGHAGSGGDAGKWVIDDANQIAGLSTTPLKMTPPANYLGSFTLRVDAITTDGATLSTGPVTDTRTNSAAIGVTIAQPNVPPVAVDDVNNAVVNGPAVTGNVLTNDTDADHDTLHVTAISGPNGSGSLLFPVSGLYGSLTIASNGFYSYAPNASITASGHVQDVFTYRVDDGKSGSATGQITITLDHAPAANDDTMVIGADWTVAVSAAIGVLVNDSDADGDTLTVTAVSSDANGAGTIGQSLSGSFGRLTLHADGAYSYAASNDQAIGQAQQGSHAHDVFTYQVDDGLGGTATAKLDFTIDRNPLVSADEAAVFAGSSVTATKASGVLANDSDPDGDQLSVSAVRSQLHGGAVGIRLAGTYGHLTLKADGSYTYAADNAAAIAAAATGSPLSDLFSYEASDGLGGTTSGDLTFTIDRAPNATTHSIIISTGATASGAAGDIDPDGDTLTVTGVKFGSTSGTVGQALGGNFGSLTIKSDGTYSYINDNILGVEMAASGSHPTDTFTYTVDDGHGGTATETLTVSINRAPHAKPDTAAAVQGGTISRDAAHGILANDSDPDGDPLAMVFLTSLRSADPHDVPTTIGGSYGTLQVELDGSYSYSATGSAIGTAPTGQHLHDFFTYVMTDGVSLLGGAELDITIDRAPDTATHGITVAEGASTGPLSAGDTDPDRDTFTVSAVQFGAVSGVVGQALAGTYGSLTINSDDTFSYQASNTAGIDAVQGSHPTDTFTYTVDDGHGGVTTETLVFTIDRAPVAADDTLLAWTQNFVQVDAGSGVLANDSDADGDKLAVTTFSNAGNVSAVAGHSLAGTYGTLLLSPNGSYAYLLDTVDAPLSSHPHDIFTYQVSDGNSGTASGELDITIDRRPIAGAVQATVMPGASVAATTAQTGVLASDSDPDGDPVSLVAISNFAGTGGQFGQSLAGAYGQLTLNTDGTYTYTADNAAAIAGAAANAHPIDTFSYMISDGLKTPATEGFLLFTIDRAPVLADLDGDTAAFTEGGAAVHLDRGTAASVSYLDARDLSGGKVTVSISANKVIAEDVLGIDTSGAVFLLDAPGGDTLVTVGGIPIGTIHSGHNGANGNDLVVDLGVLATTARVGTLIHALTYHDINAANPATAPRTVTVTLTDNLGGAGTADVTVGVSAFNSEPVLSGLGDTVVYAERGTPVVLDLDGNAAVSDAELDASPSHYAGASLTLARQGGPDAHDLFGATGTLDLSDGTHVRLAGTTVGSFAQPGDGSFTITFNASAGTAEVAAVMRQITYGDTDHNPPASVQIHWSFDDGNDLAGGQAQGDGSGTGAGATFVTITPANDPAIVSGDVSGGVTEAGGINNAIPGTPAVGGLLTDTDVDNTPNLFTPSSGASQNGYGIFTLLAEGNWTYTLDNSKPAVEALNAGQTLNDSFTVTTVDGTAQTIAITIAGADDLPFGSPSGPTSANQVTDEQVPVQIDTALTVTDPDNTTLPSATVTIGGSYQPGEDVLAFANTDAALFGNITGIFSNGVLSLASSGATATLAQWQAALRAVTYTDISDTPATLDRSISFTVNDGTASNLIATDTISVVAINDAPVNHAPFALAVTGGIDNTIAGLSVTDPDGGSASETTTLSVGHGTLTVAGAGGAAVSGSGSANVTISGTLAAINATLGGLSYHASAGFGGLDTLTVTTNDGGNSGTGGALTDTDQVLLNVDLTHLTGTPGDDSFTALPGNEIIDALGGVDTISLGFRLVDAKISFVGNQVIIDGPNGGSHTVLTGFEVYKFTDGTVNDNDGDPLVDDLFYYSQNHDVWRAGADADAHYHNYGWKEGRDPDAFFSTSTYLSLNPALKAAGTDPLLQFDQGGWKASDPSIAFDINAYLEANPDVAIAGVDPLAHFLGWGEQEGRQPIAPISLMAPNGFDYVYYLQHNPDVAAAHVDPFVQYETIGWKEGRNPNAYFDVKGYLAHYADVAAAGINPLDHYDQVGWQEGRDPSPNFDTKAYLAAYPDVAAAHVDPLEHFLKLGIAEGRTPHGDGLWS